MLPTACSKLCSKVSVVLSIFNSIVVVLLVNLIELILFRHFFSLLRDNLYLLLGDAFYGKLLVS